MSGLLRPPALPGPLVSDIGAATQAALGIVAAIVQRERTGAGSFVEVTIHEAAMAWSGPLARAQQRRVRELAQDADSPVVIFCTHDPVEYVALSAWSERLRAPANEPANENIAAA